MLAVVRPVTLVLVLFQLVGFVGLGNMGAPMANNLISKGHKLVVFDLVKPAVDAAVAAGAIKADSPSLVRPQWCTM